MKKQTPPQWVIVCLGDDLNWWLDKTSHESFKAGSEVDRGKGVRGLLDPRQVAYLVETLEEYRSHGYRRQLLKEAFQLFQVESELEEKRLRLAPAAHDLFDSGEQIFALPLIEEEKETGAYYDFLDAITAARIRKINATHHYARDCTDLEMQEELDALDRDRYFCIRKHPLLRRDQ